MSRETAIVLANGVLAIHTAAAAFIIFGLIVIPLGAKRWPWVRGFWWRLAHVAAFSIVVVQKLWGETCFLTVWENRLLTIAQTGPRQVPLVHSWNLIHVDLPLWPITGLYTALWLWTLVLWLRVPPDRSKKPRTPLGSRAFKI